MVVLQKCTSKHCSLLSLFTSEVQSKEERLFHGSNFGPTTGRMDLLFCAQDVLIKDKVQEKQTQENLKGEMSFQC